MEPLGDGDQKDGAALGIIEGVDETEPDLAEIRARLLGKMADVELIKGNVAAAGRHLTRCPPPGTERRDHSTQTATIDTGRRDAAPLHLRAGRPAIGVFRASSDQRDL
jgi:hypothetical protein